MAHWQKESAAGDKIYASCREPAYLFAASEQKYGDSADNDRRGAHERIGNGQITRAIG